MPKQPGMSRWEIASRSLNWLARKRTVAWATVSLMVLMRRVGGQVAARGEDLDRDQAVGLEGLRRAEVVDLSAGLSGAAQFHGDVLGGAVAHAESLAGSRRWQREPATGRRGHRDVGI